MGLISFNKVIDIQIETGDNSGVKIFTPTRGRKQHISIKGTLSTSDIAHTFEARLIGFHCPKIIAQKNRLEVYAGYQQRKHICMTGSIDNVYTDSPGPDAATVLQCHYVNFSDLLTKSCNLSFVSGVPFETVLYELSQAAGFDRPLIAQPLGVLPVPFYYSGLIKNALHEVRKYLPDAHIRIDGNRFIVFKEEGTSLVYPITGLCSVPHYIGDTIACTAPWIPQLRPGDMIELRSSHYTQDASAMGFKKEGVYKVHTIDFQFSTIDDSDAMNIQAARVVGRKGA